jgi:hypothetical protein
VLVDQHLVDRLAVGVNGVDGVCVYRVGTGTAVDGVPYKGVSICDVDGVVARGSGSVRGVAVDRVDAAVRDRVVAALAEDRIVASLAI